MGVVKDPRSWPQPEWGACEAVAGQASGDGPRRSSSKTRSSKSGEESVVGWAVLTFED